MKKSFLPMVLPMAFVCLLFACKKEQVIEQKPAEVALNYSKHPVITTITSESYNQTIFDSCINDSIKLTGLESYRIDTYNDSTGYLLRYEIDLTGITGVSLKGGDYYSGGGKVVNLVRQNFDGTNLRGKIDMRIVYKSNRDKIVFKQKALFIQRGDNILANFDTGYIESCKLK